MIAGLVVADLMAVGAELEDMSVPADGLIWVNGCEGLGQQARAELIAPLIARGRTAGFAVAVSSTAAAAQNLAAEASVLVAHWPVDPALAEKFGGASGKGAAARPATDDKAVPGAGGRPAAAGGPPAAVTGGSPLPGGSEFALLVGAQAAAGTEPRMLPHCRSVRARPEEQAPAAAAQAGRGA
jgi:hypothetical protein